jgi:hypothetical protein
MKPPTCVQFTATLKREQYEALKRLDADICAGLTAHFRIAVNRYLISEWAKRRELERAASRRCTTRTADGGNGESEA